MKCQQIYDFVLLVLQHLISSFAETAHLFGLKVNLKKTVLHQPAPQEEYRLPHITIEETELKTVHQFTFLGCTITPDSKTDREIDNRLAKSNNAFGRLYKKVWKNKHLKKGTKISVYRAVIHTPHCTALKDGYLIVTTCDF